MRGPSAKKFRRKYAHNLGLTWLYPTRKQLMQQQQQQQQQQHKQRIVLYCKTGGSNGHVWPHLCTYAPVLRRAFPEAEVRAAAAAAADSGGGFVSHAKSRHTKSLSRPRPSLPQVFCVVLDHMAMNIQVSALPLCLLALCACRL